MRIKRKRNWQPLEGEVVEADIDWENATNEDLERFKTENAHLFYGDIYCGENIQHQWLPFDYYESVGNMGDYFEFQYVRLDKRIDPKQTPYGYCFFYPEDGILEFGDTDTLFELTIERDFDELLRHMRYQFEYHKEKQNANSRTVLRQGTISELGSDPAEPL